MRKSSALLFIAIVVLGMIVGFVTYTVKAADPGTVDILKPIGTSEEVLFYEKITVKFEVDVTLGGWFYTGSKIYLGGVQVDYTTGGYGSPFEKDYFPETYAGVQTVTFTAYFLNLFLEEDTVSDSAQFTIKICNDTTDLTDMRINKLHTKETGKKVLYGNGVTICIVDDLLGCETRANGKFHKSLFRTCKNEINGNSERKYIDIEYYVWNDVTDEFEEDWETGVDTRQEKWQELYNEGVGDYDITTDIHGTYTLATIRRIAPAAKIIFLSTEGLEETTAEEESIYWLEENYFDLEFDILSLAFNGYEDWETELDNLADVGILTVYAAGNDGYEVDHLTKIYPYCFKTVIGVTGVPDSNHGDEEDRWERDENANTGYGVEIAAIYSASELDWEPKENKGEFYGTSNAGPMVAGILALIEQYQDSYKPTTDLNITIIQELFEETGDAPGQPPSEWGGEMGGNFSWINDEGSSPHYPYFPYSSFAPYATYNIGWGIIDGYEMYKYFKQNF
jgi:subtilisin family serine protease